MRSLLILIGIGLSGAEPFDGIINSQTIEELVIKDQEFMKWQENQKSCNIEKKRKMFPSHCFIQLLSSTGLFLNKEEWKRKKNTLNRLCVLHRDQLETLEELRSIQRNPLTSKDCQQSLLQQELDLLYIQQQ